MRIPLVFCNKKAKLPEQCTLHLSFLQLKNNWKALLLQQGRESVNALNAKHLCGKVKNLSRVQRSSWKTKYVIVLIYITQIGRPTHYWKMYHTGKIIKTMFFISVFWNGMHLKLGWFVFQLIMTLSHIPNKEPIPESSTANYVLLLKGATGIKGILGKWWVCVSLPYEPM